MRRKPTSIQLKPTLFATKYFVSTPTVYRQVKRPSTVNRIKPTQCLSISFELLSAYLVHLGLKV